MTIDLGVLRLVSLKNYDRPTKEDPEQTEHVLYTYTLGVVFLRTWWSPSLCWYILTIDRVCGETGAFWGSKLTLDYQSIEENKSQAND